MTASFHFRPIASSGDRPEDAEIGPSCPSLSSPRNSMQGESAVLASGPRDILTKILSRIKPLNNFNQRPLVRGLSTNCLPNCRSLLLLSWLYWRSASQWCSLLRGWLFSLRRRWHRALQSSLVEFVKPWTLTLLFRMHLSSAEYKSKVYRHSWDTRVSGVLWFPGMRCSN